MVIKSFLTSRALHKMDSLIEEENWVHYSVDETNSDINQISGCSPTRQDADNILVDHVRLRTSGIVEVRHLDEWGTICDGGFTVQEADVLCRQFGFELGVANIGENAIDGYPGPIHLFDLSCDGEENEVRG